MTQRVGVSTSQQRVDQLMMLSDRVYETIDQGDRAQHILSLGIHVAAQTLERSYGFRAGGEAAHGMFSSLLHTAKLPVDDSAYDVFPAYRAIVKQMRPAALGSVDIKLDDFTKQYGQVKRATMDRKGEFETDARHAVHLAALALPYAAQYHPELEQSKIALYSLVHDAPEAHAGDTPTLGISDDALKQKVVDEAAALERIKQAFHHSYPKLVRIIELYEALSDDEAKYVKTFDKLDPSFTHFDNEGAALHIIYADQAHPEEQFSIDSEQTEQRIVSYGGQFSELMRDRRTLLSLVEEVVQWK